VTMKSLMILMILVLIRQCLQCLLSGGVSGSWTDFWELFFGHLNWVVVVLVLFGLVGLTSLFLLCCICFLVASAYM
jgi:hypothetical protein